MGLRDDETRRFEARRSDDTGQRRRWNDHHQPLSQKTTVQLGFLLSIAGLVAGAIWWASDVSSTLKSINGAVQELKDERKETRVILADHETRIRLAETNRR